VGTPVASASGLVIATVNGTAAAEAAPNKNKHIKYTQVRKRAVLPTICSTPENYTNYLIKTMLIIFIQNNILSNIVF